MNGKLSEDERLDRIQKDIEIISALQMILSSSEAEDKLYERNERNERIGQTDRNMQEKPERENAASRNFNFGLPKGQFSKLPVEKPSEKRGKSMKLFTENQRNLNNEKEEQMERLKGAEGQLVERLQQEIMYEKKKRKLAENDLINQQNELKNIQKELEKESETKKSVLSTAMQLKYAIQKKEKQMTNLENENKDAKTKINELENKIQELAKLKEDVEYSLNHEIEKVEKQKCDLELASQKFYNDLQIHKEKLEIKEKENSLIRISCDSKLKNQFNLLASKYAQLEKEKQKCEVELHKTHIRLSSNESELKDAEESLERIRGDFHRENTMLQFELKNTESDLKKERVKMEVHSKECKEVTSKTKHLIEHLVNEKNSLRKCLQDSNQRRDELEKNLNLLLKETEEKSKAENEKSTKLNETLNEKNVQLFSIEKEWSDLALQFHKVEIDKKKYSELLFDAKSKFTENRKKLENEKKQCEIEKEAIEKELKNVRENLAILQKVSEDHHRTTLKLRSELEDERKDKFHLERELSECKMKEEKLKRHLEAEEDENEELREKVERLEKGVIELEHKLQSHDCEDQVESKWKGRVKEMELDLHRRLQQWKSSMEAAKRERDAAVAAARRAMEHLELTNSKCETRVLEILSQSRRENMKNATRLERQLTERTTKIGELDRDLQRVRLHSSQIQQSLTSRIQQLQNALNLCIGQPLNSFNSAEMGNFAL